MSLAEIRGKLTSAEETSEDFLTSELFENIALLGPEIWRAWLGGARTVNRDAPVLAFHMSEQPKVWQWDLWRWFPPSLPGVPGCEPDVVLIWDELLILVEMKYRSGLSGEGVSIAEQEASLVDQLGRQWFAAMEQCRGGNEVARMQPRVKDWAVVLVTQHPSIPIQSLRRSADSINAMARRAHGQCPPFSDNDVGTRLYWVDYQLLHRELIEYLGGMGDAQSADVLRSIGKKLVDILEFKGFRSFQGMQKGVAIPFPLTPFHFIKPNRIAWPTMNGTVLSPYKFHERRSWICRKDHHVESGRFYDGSS